MTKLAIQLDLLKRINVVGTSSAGKSTFARRLADLLAAPHVELDRLFWQPGWQPASPDRFQTSLQEAIRGDHWVIDGNYNRPGKRPIEHQHLTAIIWLDYSLPITLSRAFRRALHRSWTRQEIWPGTGNCESFRRNFASRDSVLLWTLTSYYPNRKKYRAMMRRPDLSSIEWIHLKHPRQAERFLQSLRHQVTPG